MILNNYSLKTKAIFILLVILAIIGIALVANYNNSRSRDVQTVANARLLAGALEKYYSLYRSYPEIDKITIDKLKYISDQGINESGSQIFYTNNVVWPTDTTLAIQGDDYQLDFSVNNSWPAWGVTKFKGGRCRILKEAVLYCVDL